MHYQVIPHREQRYNTVGDYQTDAKGRTTVRISELGSRRMEFLVGLHETVEIVLCHLDGVTDAMIDEFDFAFAKGRAPDDASEPGDDPRAPYYRQHQIATLFEKTACFLLCLNWDKYEARIAEVMNTYPSSH